MKKFLKSFIIVMVFIFTFSFCYADNLPEINCEAALLIDSDSGKVLFEKNADKSLYPASVTKLLTAILTIENCDMNDIAVASKEAIMSVPTRVYTCKHSSWRIITC